MLIQVDHQKSNMMMIAENGNPSDMNLRNPYGQISCTLLHIYSMEFGQPPLYQEINRVCREDDLSYLPMLGPFIRALNEVT